MNGLVFFVVLFGAAFLYFLPAVIAAANKHHNSNGIFILNLLLGWTLLGWVVALVWAFIKPAQPQIIYVQQPPSNP